MDYGKNILVAAEQVAESGHDFGCKQPDMTISYSDRWQGQSATSYSPSLRLPFFNPADVGAPAGTLPTSTTFRIESRFTTFNDTYNNTSCPIQFSAVASVSSDLLRPEDAAAKGFSMTINPGNHSLLPFDWSSDYVVDCLPIVQDHYSLTGFANYGFSGIPSVEGIVSVNEFLNGSVIATVTYEYA